MKATIPVLYLLFSVKPMLAAPLPPNPSNSSPNCDGWWHKLSLSCLRAKPPDDTPTMTSFEVFQKHEPYYGPPIRGVDRLSTVESKRKHPVADNVLPSIEEEYSTSSQSRPSELLEEDTRARPLSVGSERWAARIAKDEIHRARMGGYRRPMPVWAVLLSIFLIAVIIVEAGDRIFGCVSYRHRRRRSRRFTMAPRAATTPTIFVTEK